jgi:hypothetical protein
LRKRWLPLALFLSGVSGVEQGLTNPTEAFMALAWTLGLNLSKSGRGGAAPKTSMGLAQLAVGTDDDEGMRVGTAVGK